MTDLLPPLRVNQRRQSLHPSPRSGFWLLTLLLTVALTGCTDSQSGNFVEFSELQQADAPAEAEDDVAPSMATSKDEVVVVADTEVSAAVILATDSTVVAQETGSATAHETDTTVAQATDPAVAPSQGHVVDDPAEQTDVAAEDEIQEVSSSEAEPEAIKLLIPHRQFRKEGNALRATFDDIDLLKILNMAPVPIDAADYFPDWLRNLHGAHVRIRGYMRPGYEAEGITKFLFVRDNGECCYGPLPKIYDMIAVELAKGESTDLIEGTPFDVEGTLRIKPHADEVELYGLFFIEDGVIVE
jgi:hypothetical protein